MRLDDPAWEMLKSLMGDDIQERLEAHNQKITEIAKSVKSITVLDDNGVEVEIPIQENNDNQV